jgi:hypothetical protein
MVFIVLCLLLLVFSFSEILVYNEEVLLALCFIGFIDFLYSTSATSITDDFDLQTKKLISDLLQALDAKMNEELALYASAKNVTQFSNQIDILQLLFELEYLYSTSLSQSLISEASSSFTSRITDSIKLTETKEKYIQSYIIKKYMFLSLFKSSTKLSMGMSSSSAKAVIYSNYALLAEIKLTG